MKIFIIQLFDYLFLNTNKNVKSHFNLIFLIILNMYSMYTKINQFTQYLWSKYRNIKIVYMRLKFEYFFLFNE